MAVCTLMTESQRIARVKALETAQEDIVQKLESRLRQCDGLKTHARCSKEAYALHDSRQSILNKKFDHLERCYRA